MTPETWVFLTNKKVFVLNQLKNLQVGESFHNFTDVR